MTPAVESVSSYSGVSDRQPQRRSSTAFADIAGLDVHTTAIDDLAACWPQLADRGAGAGGRFVTSVLGVTRLFAPDLLVLLRTTAVN